MAESRDPSWQRREKGRRPLVLAIDDQLESLYAINLGLTRPPHDIGVEARVPGYPHFPALSDLEAMLNEIKPDFVVTDYDMGDYTGDDVLREVKRTHPEIPVILITANMAANVMSSVHAGEKNAYAAVFDKADKMVFNKIANLINTSMGRDTGTPG